MPPSVNIIRTKGRTATPPAVDYAMLVMGAASLVPLGDNAVSPPYGSPQTLAEDYGIGDGVDAACQALAKTDGNPAPPPVAFLRTPDTTPGSYRSIDVSGVIGSAVVSTTSGTHPLGTYQARVRVSDDGNDGDGGVVGSAGIYLQGSVDDGNHWFPASALGTAVTWKLYLPGDTPIDAGVQFDIAPSTTNAAYVTLAVELRADTLAHLANVTAHDAADTSAAQIALAASSVPATVTASTAAVNLVLAAMVAHVVNISAHDGPDLVAHNALAALAAATGPKTGIDLANAIKAIVNAHEGVSLAAAPAGLMGSTASIASPQTYTAAGNFLSGGVAAMDAQPRRPEFVISGGGTPADMADSVTITGFDYAGSAQTETAISLTGLGTVKATKAFKGTGLSCAFVTADGTAATFTIGYSNGGHNSADSTNLITSADATYGTLFTGDEWFVQTVPPTWVIGDIYTGEGTPTGALAAVANAQQNFGLIVLTEPVASGDVTTLTAGLDYITSTNASKRPTLLIRFRDPTVGESDADYVIAFQAWRAAFAGDARISCIYGSVYLTDALRAHLYQRSFLPALLARLQSNAVIPGALGEKLAQHPGYGARGPLEGVSLFAPDGSRFGHDERLRGGIDGPIGGKGGGITVYYEAHDEVAGVYISEAPCLYPVGSTVLTLMDNRVASGIERALYAIGFQSLQGADVFDPETLELDSDICEAMAARAMGAIKEKYSNEIQNAHDPNLVTVGPTIELSGSQVTIPWYVRDRMFGYTNVINIFHNISR